MKMSVEAKVAAVVAAGFIALTIGTIAQGNGENPIGGPDGLTNNSGVTTHISQEGDNSPRAGQTNSEEEAEPLE